jgi:hypothetical protein
VRILGQAAGFLFDPLAGARLPAEIFGAAYQRRSLVTSSLGRTSPKIL